MQAYIEPPPIPLIKKETDDASKCDIIKIKMLWNPSDVDSEMYELNIATFEHGQPEEFLALMKNFKTNIDRTGPTLAAGKINYLSNILRRESL